jgi:chemotaxis protein MotB
MYVMRTWGDTAGTAFGLLAAAALLVGPLGCVTRGKYGDMVAERDALTKRVSELQKENDSLEELHADLSSQLEARSAEINKMKGTYDALVKDLEAEVASGHVQIEQLREGIRVNLAEEILFPSGSAELNQQGLAVLGKVAADLKDAAHLVAVLGHTDNVPISSRLKSRYPSNWELGAARATRVVRLFQNKGIDGARLEAVSRGPFAPIAANQTPQGRTKNRRIEIRLMPASSGP